MAKSGASSPCQFSGIPLGGLGTGSVEIRDDGRFHEWQIMNNEPWGNAPATAEMDDDGLFFGVAAAARGKARVLMLNKLHWADRDPGYSWESLRWTTDPYHMPWMEYPDKIDYDGRFPFADLAYRAKGFPLVVTLEAFSPFIPLDSKNSGLPVAFMTFRVSNKSRERQKVGLFGALKNCVGYEHGANESVIEHHKSGRTSFLEFGRKNLPEGCQSAGSMAFGAWASKAAKATYILHAVHPRDIYDPLMERGEFENLDRSVFRGSVGNDLGDGPRVRKADVGPSRGVLCQTLTLAPRESVDVTFALAWHFPNLSQKACRDGDKMEVIGHQYSNWFSSASEAFSCGAKGFKDLRERSREFVDAFYDSTAPRWLLDAVNAPMTNFTKSTWWDKAGRFAVWEGLGCCGLQTLDISLYGAFPIVLFFPELEKSQMELVGSTAKDLGRPPHLFHGSLSCCGSYPNNRIDNAIQFIILAWRDALWTGDTDYVKRIWPAIEIYLKDIASTDTDGDGLPNNAGVDQSYDQFPLFGTSAYVGLQYIGAMKGAAGMARMIGLADKAADLALRAEKGLATLESQLWNGEYYNLSFDLKARKGNAGCMADQLCGDWFVRQSDGKGLVGDERAKSALKAVFRHCMRDNEYLANCDWPRGGRVKIRRETSDQANCPWSGVEFAVAAEMLLLGLEREGMAILRGVWQRYERFGMRYNHIECGGHYYRAMSSWAPYLALTGFAWDAEKQVLTLRVPKRKSRFIWNTPTAWGYATFRASKKALCEIEVVRGALRLGGLRLAGVAAECVTATAGGRRVTTAAETLRGETSVVLPKPIVIKEGTRLTVSA